MDRLFIRLVVTIYLLVFAVTVVAAVLVSRAYAGPVAGDPCARGPCPITGAAVGIKVPLPGQGGHPTVTVKPLVTPPRPAPGHFAGKFELVPLFDKGKPVIRNGHSYYALVHSLSFTTAAGDTVTMFAGSRTDLASTPSAVWATMPPDGAWAEAAVAHDNCYRTHGSYQFYSHAGRTRAAPYVRAECDEILRQGMVTLGVPAWKRIAIFEAVRAFGNKGWGS